jgi:hypothetical protein
MALAMTTSDVVGTHSPPPARPSWVRRQAAEHRNELTGYAIVGSVTLLIRLVSG